MSINNTTLLGLAQPVTGQESGVWGDDVNNGLTSIVDIAVAGTNNITQDSDITLSVVNGTNSTSFSTTGSNSTTAQYYVLNLTGSRSAARNIIAPATSKAYLVYNKTSGGYSITIKKSGGTGVAIAPNEAAIVYYDSITASDFVKMSSTVSLGNLTTVGTITSGTWNASVITGTYGGTGVNNGSNTITIGGNVTFSGAYTFTGTLSANTSVTFPTSGTLAALATAQSWTATQTLSGSSSTTATVLQNAFETVNVVSGTVNGNATAYQNNGAVSYYTTAASATWTQNLTFSSGTSIATALSTGQSVSFAILVTQGSSGASYYPTAINVDGSTSGVTTYWQGGSAPTKGYASGIDVYTYTVIKTASTPTYTVLASQTQF